MLLSRCQQVESCLVDHRLLLVLDFEPVADSLVQCCRFFFDSEPMVVDVFNHAEGNRQVLALWPDCLGVLRFEHLCEVLEFGLEVDLQLGSTGRVNSSSFGSWCFLVSGLSCGISAIVARGH